MNDLYEIFTRDEFNRLLNKDEERSMDGMVWDDQFADAYEEHDDLRQLGLLA